MLSPSPPDSFMILFIKPGPPVKMGEEILIEAVKRRGA
jgi:hypothetical protein